MVYLLEWKRIFFVVWDECYEENKVIKSIILWFGFKFFIEKYLILDMILLFDRDGERWFIYFKDFFWIKFFCLVILYYLIDFFMWE